MRANWNQESQGFGVRNAMIRNPARDCARLSMTSASAAIIKKQGRGIAGSATSKIMEFENKKVIVLPCCGAAGLLFKPQHCTTE
jgi:hypothetical protein